MVQAMRPQDPSRACVYLLQRFDRRRFKLGWARLPMQRLRQLPEFAKGELDVESSKAIWLPTRPRAEQVERSMHKTLAPYRVIADHARAGHQEWFAGTAADQALRLMGQMPLDEASHRTARVVPISITAPPPDAVSIETAPQDNWWAIEDLLSRLAMLLPITVAGDAEPQVTVHGFRTADEAVLGATRRAALDAETYQTRREGRPQSFVRWFAFDGDDLVLDFMPLKAIGRWDEGPELVWQVRGFLARLKRTARIRRAA